MAAYELSPEREVLRAACADALRRGLDTGEAIKLLHQAAGVRSLIQVPDYLVPVITQLFRSWAQ